MKTLPILLILLQLLACSTWKRSNSTSSESTQHDRQQSWSYRFQRDSSNTSWHFVSDSLFYFHPDSGLWANSGYLFGKRKSAGIYMRSDEKDSSVSQQVKLETKRTDKTENKLITAIIWAIVLGAGVSVFLRYVRK